MKEYSIQPQIIRWSKLIDDPSKNFGHYMYNLSSYLSTIHFLSAIMHYHSQLEDHNDVSWYMILICVVFVAFFH